MTYLVKPAARRYVRRRPALSDWFDDIRDKLSGGSEESKCIAQANQQVAPFDAKIDDLVKNWQPTGFYAPEEMRDLMMSVMATIRSAQSQLDQAAQTANASQDSIIRATNDLGRAGQRSLDYIQVTNEADQTGVRVINAPGFKRWVTDSMASASSAMVTAATIACLKPWWTTALAMFQAAFDVAWSKAKMLVGVALAAGETVLKIADDLPEIYDVLKWGVLAVGALWLWGNRDQIAKYLRP